MIYVKGKTQLPGDAEERLLAELETYRLVRERTIRWERLDDDREGEDTYEDVYSLTDENCPFELLISIDDNDYSFASVTLMHKSTESWNAGLNKIDTSLLCTLYADGRRTGSYTSQSSYDSPNNHDDVEISYSLRRLS